VSEVLKIEESGSESELLCTDSTALLVDRSSYSYLIHVDHNTSYRVSTGCRLTRLKF
jgi:hypothetical protein